MSPSVIRRNDRMRQHGCTSGSIHFKLFFFFCLSSCISLTNKQNCFSSQCPIEWFHFACVDLTTKPKGKWYVGLFRVAQRGTVDIFVFEDHQTAFLFFLPGSVHDAPRIERKNEMLRLRFCMNIHMHIYVFCLSGKIG